MKTLLELVKKARLSTSKKAALKKIEAALVRAIDSCPYNKNCFDDPTVKRLMKRRDKLLGLKK